MGKRESRCGTCGYLLLEHQEVTVVGKFKFHKEATDCAEASASESQLRFLHVGNYTGKAGKLSPSHD